VCASRFGIRPAEAQKMLLWERAVLEAGLEWEADASGDDPSGHGATPTSGRASGTTSGFLNLDEMAARGADVS
jgi:hypothetical protein